MEEFSTQTREIDDKLQLEISRLELLKDSMNRSDQMTENMISVLTSFEDRLKKLEETINPVYMETGNLQRRHENIEKTLNQLDHVIEFYHITEEVEPVIREGPSTNLEHYLSCMVKLQKAVHFFNKNSPGSSEMSHATMQFEAGKDSLEREFRSLLSRHSRPVPPVAILDLLVGEEEMMSEEPPTLEHLPEKVKSELMSIAQWLQACGMKSDYMQHYSTIRSNILLKSLTGLRDHLKTGSKDSASMGMAHSPAMSSKQRSAKDTPGSRKPVKMAFVRRASQTLMKHSMAHFEAAEVVQQVKSFIMGDKEGVVYCLRRQPTNSADVILERHEVDIDFFIHGASTLLKLIQSEAALMQGIIPMKHERKIFDMLIQASLDSVIKEGEQIASKIKQATSRHDHSAVLGIFPVLRHLRAIKPEFDLALEGCTAPTRSKLAVLISSLDATGAKALGEFVDSIRNDPDKSSNMPRDGTVHELASNTLIFLEQLLEFAETAGSMFLTQDPNVTKKDPELERKRKVAEYITRVLAALDLNLCNKSETYGDPTLKAIFMLNNFNYILKSLKRSGLVDITRIATKDIELCYEEHILKQKRLYSQRAELLPLVHIIRPEWEDVLNKQITEQKQVYSESWSRVLHYILDSHRQPITKASPEPGVKLKDKDRQVIKEKFTGFNKELEEIHRIQKGYAIPDPELRDTLRADNQDYVAPKYKTFYDKYSRVNFTKNPEKYIRYTPSDVSRSLSEFFDAAA